MDGVEAGRLRVDGYIRISHGGDRRGKHFISPVVRRERIDAWARAHGAQVMQIHEELDESRRRADRRLLQEAIRRIQRGTTRGLGLRRADRALTADPLRGLPGQRHPRRARRAPAAARALLDGGGPALRAETVDAMLERQVPVGGERALWPGGEWWTGLIALLHDPGTRDGHFGHPGCEHRRRRRASIAQAADGPRWRRTSRCARRRRASAWRRPRLSCRPSRAAR